MLAQCWPTVCDADPASNQHWFNASCLLITAGLVVLTAGGEMEVSAYSTSVHITMEAKAKESAMMPAKRKI